MSGLPWVLDSVMLDRAEEHGRMDRALQRSGTPYHLVTRETDTGLSKSPLPEAVLAAGNFIAYGSHQFCRDLFSRYPKHALCFGLTDRTEYVKYTSEMPEIPFLNPQAVLSTWHGLRSRMELWRGMYPGQGVFTRPNSGFKTYAGQVLRYDDWEHDTNGLQQTSSVMADTLVVVAPLQEILGEFRFVVSCGQVVAGSEYRWDNKLDRRRDWPPECWDLAQQVASRDGWTVDTTYVVDVALTPQGPRVVELNSFCCAGMYSCDLDLVVSAVNRAAQLEITGEVE